MLYTSCISSTRCNTAILSLNTARQQCLGTERLGESLQFWLLLWFQWQLDRIAAHLHFSAQLFHRLSMIATSSQSCLLGGDTGTFRFEAQLVEIATVSIVQGTEPTSQFGTGLEQEAAQVSSPSARLSRRLQTTEDLLSSDTGLGGAHGRLASALVVVFGMLEQCVQCAEQSRGVACVRLHGTGAERTRCTAESRGLQHLSAHAGDRLQEGRILAATVQTGGQRCHQ
mmetsp:Transcript_30043/g.75618  ORF Transcript_30043/g.75618 Transcript_30043/m.75618 type:complete len:227 (-) Transcript_30043:2741-3421(-)